MDYSLPGSSVHGISQTRILEWVVISCSRGSSRPRDWTWVSCIGRRILSNELPGMPYQEAIAVQLLSCVWHFATPWTAACHASLSFIIFQSSPKAGSQEIPRVTGKFELGVQNEAGQRLIEFCQENALVIANTIFQQHKRQLYTWTPPGAQYRNQIDYVLYSWTWRSPTQSAKKKKTESWLWLRSWTSCCQIET